MQAMKKGKMRTTILKEKRDESIRRMLDAAMEVFAEAGYEGARVDEIARRAGVNKAMIYYRIGDKKTIYEAVVHDVFGDITKRLSENIRKDFSPEEKLKTYIDNLAATMDRLPSFPRIMMREATSGWVHLNGSALKDISGILGIISDIIDEGVKKGAFTRVNPVLVHLMTIGTLLLYNLSMPVRKNFQSLLSGKIKQQDVESSGNIAHEIQKIVLRAIKV
jgi:TetR/AcrR family transcriptional regulator